MVDAFLQPGWCIRHELLWNRRSLRSPYAPPPPQRKRRWGEIAVVAGFHRQQKMRRRFCRQANFWYFALAHDQQPICIALKLSFIVPTLSLSFSFTWSAVSWEAFRHWEYWGCYPLGKRSASLQWRHSVARQSCAANLKVMCTKFKSLVHQS